MAEKKDITSAPASVGTAAKRSPQSDIEAFLKRASQLEPVSSDARGRLVFALDATMSRQPTWDIACNLQGAMFDAAGSIGGLNVQLVYFRGFGECQASKWVSNTKSLRDLMVRIECRGGQTQIGKVLAHARREAQIKPVAALVYVGDAMEENVDRLCQMAGELGLLNIKTFMFHEGHNPVAERAFREIARLTGGAYLPFNAAAAAQLKALLGAVATYAAGGRKALEKSTAQAARLLLSHLK